jgi:hypothetical protein
MKYFKLFIVSLIIISCSNNKIEKHHFYEQHVQLGDGYSSIQNEIFYKQSVPGYSSYLPKPVKIEASYNSFVNLSNGYAKDDTQIFYKGFIISNADYKSFSVIPIENEFPKISTEMITPTFRSKEQPTLMRTQSMFKDQFILTLEFYAKDKNNVYYGINVIPNADSNTFQILSILYSKDINSCYFCGKQILDSEPNTFEIMGVRWAKDNNHVYFNEQIISNNPNSFEFLNLFYAKDNHSIWYYNALWLPNSKLDTLKVDSVKDFQLITDRYAKNSNNVFLSGKIIENADVNSFQYLGNFWGKDNSNIYRFDKICKEANYDSFVVTSEGAIDKNRFYDMNFKVRD